MTDRVIAHKDYNTQGGGEHVAEVLAECFDAPLVVGHENRANQPADMDIREVGPESRYHWLIERGGLPRALANMFLWRDYGPDRLADYDTVITSGNEPLWYPPRDYQTIVAYTHSTPRYMYDLHHTADGFVNRSYLQAQKVLYESNVRRPDLWVANSELVARRIRLYWGVPRERVTVVHPPTPVAAYDPDAADTVPGRYLYLGRLVEAKRVDEVIRAVRGRDCELVIAGKGPDRERLERLAGDNVSFEGFVSERRKRELLASATVLVFPALNEDFGMVPVEALAAGTPVIGVSEGFTQYQIADGRNGLLYERGDLPTALDRFERDGVAWDAEQMHAFAAANFGRARFEREMRHVVEQAERDTAIEPDWRVPDPAATETAATLTDGGGDGSA